MVKSYTEESTVEIHLITRKFRIIVHDVFPAEPTKG